MGETSAHKTPGQLIESLLTERGWTKRVLAIVMGMDETNLNRIVSDKRPLTAEVALTLEEVFDMPAERFLTLQRDLDLAKARLVVRVDPGRASRARVFGGLPVAEMVKRGWLEADDVRDVPRVEASLCKFFGVTNVDDIEALPHAARKADASTGATPAQLAWLHRVRQIASEMVVAPFSELSGRRAVEKIKALTLSMEEVRKVPRILSEGGIRFVLVESLPAAKIDGACLWLREGAPVIGMSLRHDRIDNFWFVLRHEIEHVLRGHGKTIAIIDAELEGARAGVGPEVADEERIANKAAAEFCVPTKAMDSFVARKAPFFAERDILGLAATLKVHPGLVAGQLQHRTGRYDRFRSHLVKVRSAIAPSAVVDGWGDVAPVGQ
jgi:HTH-type transcriptional regulator/antitoxin HigA